MSRFNARVSTADGQTTENQLRQLHETAQRLDWTVVAVEIQPDTTSIPEWVERTAGVELVVESVSPNGLSYRFDFTGHGRLAFKLRFGR